MSNPLEANAINNCAFCGFGVLVPKTRSIPLVTLTSSLSLSAFSRRMEELKSRLKKQDEDDTSESDSDKLP